MSIRLEPSNNAMERTPLDVGWRSAAGSGGGAAHLHR